MKGLAHRPTPMATPNRTTSMKGSIRRGRRSELHRHHRAPGRDEHAHGGGDDRGVGPRARRGPRQAVAERAPAQKPSTEHRRHVGGSPSSRGLVQATVGRARMAATASDVRRSTRTSRGRSRDRPEGVIAVPCRHPIDGSANPAGPGNRIAADARRAPDERPGDGAGPGGLVSDSSRPTRRRPIPTGRCPPEEAVPPARRPTDTGGSRRPASSCTCASG